MTARQIIRTYLAITGMFNAAMALIWGVNTLFLLGAGLDIFEVMLTNAAFTVGSVVFEVPTGVVADTLGRRASLLMCLVTLLVTTLLYVGAAWLGLGMWAFVAVSILLGLGFTFYSGAVDAWLVDALKHAAYTEPLDDVFARGHATFGAAMLVGTLVGGLLGQVHLYLPYLLRAALVLPLIAVALLWMRELGFQPRTLELRRVPGEMRRVFVEGMRHGLGHPVLRPVMLATATASTFGIFGFYSWQRYFLDLLGRDAVWVNGVIASLIALSTIVGNFLVRPLSRVVRTRTGLLAATIVVEAVCVVLCGLARDFYVVVGLYLVSTIGFGLVMPVKSAYLNAHIPSEQRATLISLDSLFGNLGGTFGQVGWGWLARQRSIADAWVAAGATLVLALPFYWQARRRDQTHDAFAPAAAPRPAA